MSVKEYFKTLQNFLSGCTFDIILIPVNIVPSRVYICIKYRFFCTHLHTTLFHRAN